MYNKRTKNLFFCDEKCRVLAPDFSFTWLFSNQTHPNLSLPFPHLFAPKIEPKFLENIIHLGKCFELTFLTLLSYIFIALSLFLIYLFRPLSLFLFSLLLSLFLYYILFFFSLSPSFSLCPSLSLCLSLSVYLSLSISHCLSLSLSLSVYLSLSFSLSLSIFFSFLPFKNKIKQFHKLYWLSIPNNINRPINAIFWRKNNLIG